MQAKDKGSRKAADGIKTLMRHRKKKKKKKTSTSKPGGEQGQGEGQDDADEGDLPVRLCVQGGGGVRERHGDVQPPDGGAKGGGPREVREGAVRVSPREQRGVVAVDAATLGAERRR